ncbi:MAG: DUF1508 domain-containing protein, partial [Burkholderiaceae bacterium]|nr:DUF1508 domain-containing protein [Burkholderiaceae bacterium]
GLQGKTCSTCSWLHSLECWSLLKNRGGSHMARWYEPGSYDKGRFSFVLKVGEGEVILHREQYSTKASAQNAMKSAQTNSGDGALPPQGRLRRAHPLRPHGGQQPSHRHAWGKWGRQMGHKWHKWGQV